LTSEDLSSLASARSAAGKNSETTNNEMIRHGTIAP
jgi:hypothetical protein